jgi:ADP-heptose:LPS heptosyltransferase
VGRGSSCFLGRSNYISAEIDKNIFYQEANRMLAFLGFKEVPRAPRIDFIKDDSVLKQYALTPKEYVVIHLAASHVDRSFPEDKWHRVIKSVQEHLRDVTLVFTGSEKDTKFVEDCLGDLPREHVILACGRASTQQLLTLHAEAILNVTVHTGNAHFINMLHVPTITLNIKGVYFFKFFYNEKGVELVSAKDCTCDPYERDCTMIAYKGNEYMACLYNIGEQDVVKEVVSMYSKYHDK